MVKEVYDIITSGRLENISLILSLQNALPLRHSKLNTKASVTAVLVNVSSTF